MTCGNPPLLNRVDCRHCGHPFQAPRSLRGGFVNCPSCGKASEIRSGPEPLFWLLLGVGILVAAGIVSLLYVAAGGLAATIAAAVCALIIAAVVAAS